MNQKTVKRLRRRAKVLAVETWMNFLPEDEANTYTLQEVVNSLPKTSYINTTRGQELSAYSLRWTIRKVKRNPLVTMQELLPH